MWGGRGVSSILQKKFHHQTKVNLFRESPVSKALLGKMSYQTAGRKTEPKSTAEKGRPRGGGKKSAGLAFKRPKKLKKARPAKRNDGEKQKSAAKGVSARNLSPEETLPSFKKKVARARRKKTAPQKKGQEELGGEAQKITQVLRGNGTLREFR